MTFVESMHRTGEWLGKRRADFRLAFRVTIAGAIAFALAQLLVLPQGYWAVITAVIVMQASVGGSLKAAIDRFLGTFAGAIYGAVVSAFVPHASSWQLGTAIVIALAPLALLASIKTSFRVAPITALIVLLPTSAHTLGPVVSAIDRVLEITLGNLVGVAVALLILPSRAHTLLTEAAAQVVRLNAELVTLLLNGVLADAGAIGTPALHARIRASLKQVESAADEAARERKSHLTDAPDPEPLVRTLYRVRHDFVMIGRAAASPLDERIRVRLATCIAQIRDAAQTFLVALADALQMRGSPPSATAFDESLAALVGEMETMRGEHFLEPLPAEAVARLYALRFSLEQLRQDLDDLDARTREMMLKRKDSDGATRQPPDGG